MLGMYWSFQGTFVKNVVSVTIKGRQWKPNLGGLLGSMNDWVKRSSKKKKVIYSQSLNSNSSTHCHIIKKEVKAKQFF